jgi:hypothetical protein
MMILLIYLARPARPAASGISVSSLKTTALFLAGIPQNSPPAAVMNSSLPEGQNLIRPLAPGSVAG